MTTDPTSATRNRTGVAARPAPGQPMQDRRFNVKGWLLWTAGFLSFPIAGIAAQAAAGRINDAVAALVGGLVAGAVIGTGQWLAARRLLGDPLAWIAATAAAMGIGLLAGAWAAGYGTSVGELALMGAITGLPLGAAQAFLLRHRVARSWAWAAAIPLLWAGLSLPPPGSMSTASTRSSAPSARSPSWPCPGSCWTGCAPPPQPHHPRSTARQPRPPSKQQPQHVLPPGSSAPAGSPTRSWPKPSPPSAPRPAPAPSKTPDAPAAPSTTPPCANSPAASPASSTDASRPAPSTTRQPPGRTGKRPLNLTSPLDT